MSNDEDKRTMRLFVISNLVMRYREKANLKALGTETILIGLGILKLRWYISACEHVFKVLFALLGSSMKCGTYSETKYCVIEDYVP